MEKVRIVAEAEKRELKERAFWAWHVAPPIEGRGNSRRLIPFGEWWGRLKRPVQSAAPEISDEEVERLMKQGRVGLGPPGVKVRE